MGLKKFYTCRSGRENEETAYIDHLFGDSKYGLPKEDETTPLMLNQKKKSHVKWGTLEYKYVICEKLYKNLTDRKKRATVHSDQKSYSCDKCTKMFPQKYSLKVHLKIHMRGKSFKCLECEQCSELSNLLKKHMKTLVNTCDSDVRWMCMSVMFVRNCFI
jgi:hypothetical protein